MAAVASDEVGGERFSSGQRCQSVEALAEWRSSEQVVNGIPSTSPPYWYTDDDDDSGPKPSKLFGRHTWKIEKFSQINKREHRGNVFEVGGYKWYILIYPQGCDVCNHLSLFLCVANHDKLLPGWSHFAQFTIAVVNKDPKKSKYSDTLHRFWKKEHDWGWKKFMELSKVYDGFIDSDTLIIKAQVQVLRERVDRPFRCLDCEYRRELVRVYLTNVETVCRRFMEERRGKLGRLLEDKARWSSLCAFWLGIDQNARRRMSREKTDMILKVVVKHFFIEKEVTSTLVMDSLYSGLKALEGQSKRKKGKSKSLETEEMPAPIVHVEKDMFVLVDDVLVLLERAALEPLPPKEEKGPQNRTKDGNSGEDFNKDSIERDERRLTELGRRTVEIFVLAHIFSNKIEVAYQELVALKRQEELIREEEAAWLAESGQKGKRGASEKEKKSKKKQAKQKRNNRKGKEKGREEKANVAINDKHGEENLVDEKESGIDEMHHLPEKSDVMEDDSDVSDSVDGVPEVLQPDSEDRDASPVNWDTDTSEVHPPTEASSSGVSVQNGVADKRSPSVGDDSSSTCSTDSVPLVVMNGTYRGNFFNNQNQESPIRGKNQCGRATFDGSSWTSEIDNRPSGPVQEAGDLNDASESSKAGESESEAVVSSLQSQTKWLDQGVVKKEIVGSQKKQIHRDQVDLERPKEKTTAIPSSHRSPPRSPLPTVHLKSEHKSAATVTPVPVRKASSNGSQHTDQAVPPSASSTSSQMMGMPKYETQKAANPKPTEKPLTSSSHVMSRSSSAPLVPGPKATIPAVSIVQTTPLLARSVTAAGRLDPDPSPATHSYVPQSYRNAMIGNHVGSGSAGFAHPNSSSSGVNPSPAYSQPSPIVSATVFLSQSSERIDQNSVQSSFPYGMVKRDALQNGPQWMDGPRGSRSMHCDPSPLLSGIQNLDLCQPVQSSSRELISSEFPACKSQRQTQGGAMADEFPHLDIINYLLDEEHGIGKVGKEGSVLHPLGNGSHPLNRHSSFPSEMSISGEMGPLSASCRFERARSFHGDGFQRGYGSLSHFDIHTQFIPQASPLPYANGQIDGLIPAHWQMAGSDLSLLGMRNSESDSYPYLGTDYSNLTCGVNGYTLFRPSNGH
ncbi:hypothetical protein SLE2022_168950 [Rubroshorea leprosula]